MSRGFVNTTLGKLTLINCGTAFGLLVAYKQGYRGLDLLCLSIASIVILNIIGVFGVWIGKKSPPGAPNKFLPPLWIALAILGIIYLLYYFFPAQ